MADEILLRSPADPDELQRLGVADWPIWEHPPAEFPWTYDAREACYILKGEFTVTPAGGPPVAVRAGDYVVFPAGMSCTWTIRQAVRKHYRFG